MTTSQRFFPSSFDPDDAHMTGNPLPLDWRWRSAEDALTSWGSRGVMMRLPLFWQLEVPLFHACQSAGAFLFANDVGNMPLGAAAVDIADVDTVVTELDDAAAFASYLTIKRMSLPKYWFIVRKSSHAGAPLPPELTGNGISVHEEVHSSPGIIVTNMV